MQIGRRRICGLSHVSDLVRTGLALGYRNRPFRRRGADQHQARGSSRRAHHLEELADGMRRVCVLSPVATVSDSLNDPHGVPMGV